MTEIVKKGALRLLQSADLLQKSLNAFGKALVGWLDSKSSIGFVNKQGWALLRVVVKKNIGGEGLKDLYDQCVVFENPGSVVLCLVGEGDNMKVGLIQNYRFVGERVPVANVTNYVAELEDTNGWNKAVESLGRDCWEAPRGLIPPVDESDLVPFVVKTAKLEALQESGLRIADAKIAGRLNANSTFFPHAQYVVVGKVVGQTDSRPEVAEIIGSMKLFGKSEVRRMVDTHELDDGMTLAAMAIAGFHF